MATPYFDIDEKPFHKGHRIISSPVDLQQGRVLDGVEDRTEAACQALIAQSPPRQARGPLTPEQKQQATGVTLDMWKAYMNSVEEKLSPADIVNEEKLPQADIVNEALGRVCRQENKRLKKIFVEQFNKPNRPTGRYREPMRSRHASVTSGAISIQYGMLGSLGSSEVDRSRFHQGKGQDDQK